MAGTSTTDWMMDLDRRFRAATNLDIGSYKIFYSRIQPAEILVLGINPGGNPSTFHKEVPLFYPQEWVSRILANEFWFEKGEHEYVDCSYPIARAMTRFLGSVTGTGPEQIRGIPKTNLAFRRSPGVDQFRALHGITLEQAKDEARPFVEEVLRWVQPRMIVLEGVSLMQDFLSGYGKGSGRTLIGPVMTPYRGRLARVCIGEEVTISCLGRPVAVIAIGHPSSFGRLPGFDLAIAATRRLFDELMRRDPAAVTSTVGSIDQSIPGHPAEEAKTGAPSRRSSPPVPHPDPKGSTQGSTEKVSRNIPGGTAPDGAKPRDNAPPKFQTVSGEGACRPVGRNCQVRRVPEGKLNRLEIWREGVLLGEYERSNDREVDRKIGEIVSALDSLLDVYENHGRFQVRWDGKQRTKVVRDASGHEVAVIGKEHWGKPNWEK